MDEQDWIEELRARDAQKLKGGPEQHEALKQALESIAQSPPGIVLAISKEF